VSVILAIGAADDLVRERLEGHGRYVEVAADDRDAIARHLPTAVGIAARATAVVDAAVIEAAPALRVIGRSGVGVDRVDLDAATARGIPVVITPNAATRAVAEGALALILHLVKRLSRLTALVRDGAWATREEVALGDLDGATLGIVGYGRIGRRLAELAAVLGMQVLAYDPYADPDAVDPAVTLNDLPALLARADAISLHAPLTAKTQGLIGRPELARVKPGAVLVNCGRGGLLDLDAAHDALRAGRLSGVGLDVFDPEPPAHHPLFDHPDVVLTPHVMALSRRARRLVFADMSEGMSEVLAGRRAPHVANPNVYEQRKMTAQ
jgi:D-3-phosphoglycerate dehydrogenase / 2-oxoglutarate reductase